MRIVEKVSSQVGPLVSSESTRQMARFAQVKATSDFLRQEKEILLSMIREGKTEEYEQFLRQRELEGQESPQSLTDLAQSNQAEEQKTADSSYCQVL